MKIICRNTSGVVCILLNILCVPLYLCFVAVQVLRCCRQELFFVKMEDALS
jgi:hypothetical protein